MKKSVSVSFDSDKYLALKSAIQPKGTTVEEELAQALDGLYQKMVPAAVRTFLDMKEKEQKAKKKASSTSDGNSTVREDDH